MKNVRVGVIGVGGMAGRHAELFKENPRAELVCICDIVEETARKKAGKLGCEYTTDHHELLARGDIDAVLVGVPNTLHYPIALDALRAGKHTSVEYPITQTLAQHDELRGLAEAGGLVLHDALTPLIEPQALKMKELVGKLGRVMTMRSVYISGAGRWYVDSKVRGNFFAALTIHQIVYFNVALGATPDWVDGAVHYAENGEHRIHSGAYLCGYPGGVLAYNEWGMGFPHACGTWEWTVEGENGRLAYETPKNAPHRIRFVGGGRDEIFEVEPQAIVHPKEIENFVAQILDGVPPYCPPAQSRAIIAIFEAAQQSADTGRRVNLSAD
ncbi:MAG: Gfo/Idh/MocA family oxidoreductase [Kiritimatiellae bacterium]|nr:Gfo/Idh/MocA family oxidoreductase [Kiritimatiellia bacterium]